MSFDNIPTPELWFQILDFLEPLHWCHFQATNKANHTLIESFFDKLEQGIPQLRKSKAWTSKERVCRYYLAHNFCQERTRKINHIHLCQEGSLTGTSSNSNFLDSEFFVQIGRRLRTVVTPHDHEKFCMQGFKVLWEGFLPPTCNSLRLEPIQNEICDSNENGSWDEWLALLRHASNLRDDEQWKEEWRRRKQNFYEKVSIMVVRINHWLPSCIAGHSDSSNTKRSRLPTEVVFYDPILARKRLSSSSSHMAVHLEDARSTGERSRPEEYYARLRSELQSLAETANEDSTPYLHVWIKTTLSPSNTSTMESAANRPPGTYHSSFVQLRLDNFRLSGF